MRKLGIPEKLIRMVRFTMREVRCMVQIGGVKTGEFISVKGLRCSDMSPLWFSFRDSGIQVGGTWYISDDINITGYSFQAVSDGFLKLAEAERKMGFKVIVMKLWYMVTEENPRPGKEITIAEYMISLYSCIKLFEIHIHE